MEDDDMDRARKARKGSPFLTAKQAAHYLGLGTKTLAHLRCSGEGPNFRRHGGRINYHIDDLDAWSAERARTSTRSWRERDA
jgi:hypothetical protein